MLGRLRRIQGDDLPDSRLLADAFPNPHYLWLRRRDIVAQAVSWARALQTDQWQSSRAPLRDPKFDFAQIAGLVQLVRDEEAAWSSWFESNGIAAEEVFYEDLAAEPRQEVSKIVGSLGLELPANVELRPYPGFERQADALNIDWCNRYRARSKS